jgi:hypothetical protein
MNLDMSGSHHTSMQSVAGEVLYSAFSCYSSIDEHTCTENYTLKHH